MLYEFDSLNFTLPCENVNYFIAPTWRFTFVESAYIKST